MRKKTLLVTTLAAVMAVNMAGCGLLGGNGQNSPVNMNYDVNVNVNGQDVVNASNNPGGNSSNASSSTVQNVKWVTSTAIDNGYEYTLQGSGVDDDFELGNGLTFGELATYMESSVERFDKEHYRKTFSLINVSSDEYRAKVKKILNMNNEDVCPDMLFCMQAAISWELYNHFGNIEKVQFVEDNGKEYMICINDHSIVEADLVYCTDTDEYFMLPANMDLSNKMSINSAGLNDDAFALFLTSDFILLNEKYGFESMDFNSLYSDDWR